VTTSQDLRPTVAIADPDVGEREMAGVRDVLASGQLSAGETVQSFEAEFASYCGVDHGVATSNRTTALHTALEALDLGRGHDPHHAAVVHCDGERDSPRRG